MPTYDYSCEKNNHPFSEVRSLTDDTPKPETCPVEGCGSKLRRVFGTPPIIFKGSGFSAKRG